MSANGSPITDTPRNTRNPVPSKLSQKPQKQPFQFQGTAAIKNFEKIYYPSEDLISQVDVSRASLKYKALSFGLEKLDDTVRLNEMRAFSRFYNRLPVSITELFDVQSVKMKHSQAGLDKFTALQHEFIAAGVNTDIQMELVGKLYKKTGSPTRARIVRSIQREKVLRDAAEYERKQKENAAILQAELDCEMHTDAPQTVETVPLPPKELQQIHVEKAALDAIAQKRVNEEKIRTDFNASLAQQSIVLNQLMDNPVVEAKTPEVDEEIMSSSGSDSESDSEEKPWMIAGSFKQKFLPKQQKITDSETSKIFEISLLHNTSEMKWAVLMNLIKSVFKKIEVDCAIVGTKDHFLTNTKSRSVVKVISIRLKSDEDTSQLLATIQDAAPALNIDTPGAVLKAANAAEYSWRGLSAILGDSYGVMEIQQLLDSAAPTRFRITDFTVEATTDELTHLNISRDTCKTKILDNEGDLEDVDEFIFMKAVTLHGIETTVNAKALNLYTVKKRGHNLRNILKHSLGTKRVRCKKCGGRNHLAKDCQISDAEIRATSEIKRAKKARKAVSAFFK